MNDLLKNPVYNSLLTSDKHLGNGNNIVKYFDQEVSPFVGFEEGYSNGFNELYEMLPAGRKILYANPSPIEHPKGWEVQHAIKGLQFMYENRSAIKKNFSDIKILTNENVEEMITLARLTKPGPFDVRTIDFGYYHGIFENNKLVAMTGQRLHVENYSEISAVCTHPDHTGKGYAHRLLLHQLQIILQNEQIPFLHVREDNARAIEIYERIGFKTSRPMNFYFMKKI
jgi:ribosomal protein S18 acetylase RimI-like enzyme